MEYIREKKEKNMAPSLDQIFMFSAPSFCFILNQFILFLSSHFLPHSVSCFLYIHTYFKPLVESYNFLTTFCLSFSICLLHCILLSFLPIPGHILSSIPHTPVHILSSIPHTPVHILSSIPHVQVGPNF